MLRGQIEKLEVPVVVVDADMVETHDCSTWLHIGYFARV